MTTIYARATDQVLTGTILPKVACSNRNTVQIHVDFDSTWHGYAKSAVFCTEDDPAVYEVPFSSTGNCTIPAEVLAYAGRLNIYAKGVKSASGAVKSTTPLTVRVLPGTPAVIVSAPPDTVYHRLLEAVSATDARMDNIARLPAGSTAGDAELADIRVGANGRVYGNAGSAVRAQIAEKISAVEEIPVEYEIGNIGITVSGWDYGEKYYQTTRVRVKEGAEIRLVAGDVIGLTDYTNARFYVGYRDDLGKYFFAGWLTSDFVCPTEGDYVILVANTTDTEQTDASELGNLISVRKVDGVANVARNCGDLISAAVDLDLGVVLGSANAGGFIAYKTRYVTRDIQILDFDIVLKRSPEKYRMAVHTYTSDSGDGYKDHGWVTDNGDYIIPAGTFFRILVMAKDYETESALVIDPARQYETDLYKSIEIYPVVGKKINLVRTAKTLARISAMEAQNRGSRRIPAPPRMRSINHRGWNWGAPENTLPAYKLSKKNGFDFAECDVRWTSDGVPVLLHDAAINRTARNADGSEISATVNIADITYSAATAYDFGCYFSDQYRGTKIPAFEEFIALCRAIQLHPYIEIYEEITAEQAEILMGIVRKYGMQENVTWISFTHISLQRIVENNPRSRVGYNRTADHTGVADELHMVGLLMTGVNEAFANVAHDNANLAGFAESGYALGIPVEVWCPNTAEEILSLPVYVSGVTSDTLIAHKVHYEANIN